MKKTAEKNVIDLDLMKRKTKSLLNGGPDCNGRTKLYQLKLYERLDACMNPVG